MTTDTDTPFSFTAELVEQVDWQWRTAIRPRLQGLTDAEYFWQPAPDTWSVHRRDTPAPASATMTGGSGEWVVDFAVPEPQPAAFTSIAWRLAHVIVGVLAMRSAGYFGRAATDYDTFSYAGTAAEALAQLDEEYARWIDGVRGWDDADLQQPCGPVEGPFASASRVALVLHINRELIHHLAEVALLRDLYGHTR